MARWALVCAVVAISLLVIEAGDKRQSQANAAQYGAANTDGWRQAADQSTRPLGPDAIPPRGDPDSIYQRGNPAGKVTGARITLDGSRIYFAWVSDAENLDTTKPFVFRGYMLRFVGADAGNGVEQPYRNMVCAVRGRAR
jgi:hypothetical protein